ncbi:hypothetical protein OHB49_45180 (plasmid) [Streptomyces sp. NBC_01717]|uniref:hypothetical protein n=1 Tax=Streptomyces sp. NBC_01717 TaxID=2975918 RepID=UPI002E3033A9|nr:hypothetical protein [Streptomyces sp. NBC_01717]
MGDFGANVIGEGAGMESVEAHMKRPRGSEGYDEKPRWEPDRVEIRTDSSKGTCGCPCDHAHVYRLRESCKKTIVADAVTLTGTHSVPLCGPCAAVQLSQMEKGRRPHQVTKAQRQANLAGSLLALALFVGLVWYFGDSQAALVMLFGAFVGVCVWEQNK